MSAQLATDPEKLLSCLSYSHFEMLVEIDDPLKRAFYEHECIRGNWSVRPDTGATGFIVVGGKAFFSNRTESVAL